MIVVDVSQPAPALEWGGVAPGPGDDVRVVRVRGPERVVVRTERFELPNVAGALRAVVGGFQADTVLGVAFACPRAVAERLIATGEYVPWSGGP